MSRGHIERRHRPHRDGLLAPALAMAGAALVLSFGAARLIERNLEVHGGEAGMEIEAPHADAPGEDPRGPIPLEAYLDPIVERDLFDSASRTRVPNDGPVGSGISGEAVLLATVVADRKDQSSALIATGETIGGYGQGDWLLQEARITRIDQGVVTLRSASGEVRRLVMRWQRAEL